MKIFGKTGYLMATWNEITSRKLTEEELNEIDHTQIDESKFGLILKFFMTDDRVFNLPLCNDTERKFMTPIKGKVNAYSLKSAIGIKVNPEDIIIVVLKERNNKSLITKVRF